MGPSLVPDASSTYMEAFFYFSRLSGNPSVLIGSPRPPLASVSIDPASGGPGRRGPRRRPAAHDVGVGPRSGLERDVARVRPARWPPSSACGQHDAARCRVRSSTATEAPCSTARRGAAYRPTSGRRTSRDRCTSCGWPAWTRPAQRRSPSTSPPGCGHGARGPPPLTPSPCRPTCRRSRRCCGPSGRGTRWTPPANRVLLDERDPHPPARRRYSLHRSSARQERYPRWGWPTRTHTP